MKAKINKEGRLQICPENTTENYAIIKWMKINSKGRSFKKGSIRFDFPAYVINLLKE